MSVNYKSRIAAELACTPMFTGLHEDANTPRQGDLPLPHNDSQGVRVVDTQPVRVVDTQPVRYSRVTTGTRESAKD